jgi:hypothetical protein
VHLIIRRKRRRKLLNLFSLSRYRMVRKDYYTNTNLIHHSSDLQRLLAHHREDADPITKMALFRGLEFGLSKDMLIQMLGKPRYRIDNSLLPGHSVFFYKEKAGRISSRLQLHFLYDRFFYANQQLDPTRVDKSELARILAEKYRGDAEADVFEGNLRDPQGNFIAIKSSPNIEIDYISGDPVYRNLLEHRVELRRQYQRSENRKALENIFRDI